VSNGVIAKLKYTNLRAVWSSLEKCVNSAVRAVKIFSVVNNEMFVYSAPFPNQFRSTRSGFFNYISVLFVDRFSCS
jgi:hypothetical protein